MIRSTHILPIIILIAFLISGCHHRKDKTPKSISFLLARQTDTLIRAGNLDSAQFLIEKALQLYPANYIAYNNKAVIEIKRNKPASDIINDLEKSLSIWPDYHIALYTLANYYSFLNDYENTIKISSRYLSLQLTQDLDKPQLGQIYYLTGEAEEHLLQFDNAIADLKKALEINPEDAVSHYDLAGCYYYGKNDIPVAIAQYTKTLEIDKTYYRAYYGREHCDRNSNPPLTKQATSDSTNAELYDTSHSGKPSSIYSKLEKARASTIPGATEVLNYYDTLVALYRPNKLLQQKVINNLTECLQQIHNDNPAVIDTKHLQKINNDAIAQYQIFLEKIDHVREVDSTINYKKQLLDYENLLGDFMINYVPKAFKIFAQNHDQGRLKKVFNLLMPTMILIKQKGIDYYNTEEALLNKYSLH